MSRDIDDAVQELNETRDELARLKAVNRGLVEWLETIAARDELVEASDGAWALQAFRRCQTLARAALQSAKEQTDGKA